MSCLQMSVLEGVGLPLMTCICRTVLCWTCGKISFKDMNPREYSGDGCRCKGNSRHIPLPLPSQERRSRRLSGRQLAVIDVNKVSADPGHAGAGAVADVTAMMVATAVVAGAQIAEAAAPHFA